MWEMAGSLMRRVLAYLVMFITAAVLALIDPGSPASGAAGPTRVTDINGQPASSDPGPTVELNGYG